MTPLMIIYSVIRIGLRLAYGLFVPRHNTLLVKKIMSFCHGSFALAWQSSSVTGERTDNSTEHNIRVPPGTTCTASRVVWMGTSHINSSQNICCIRYLDDDSLTQV